MISRIARKNKVSLSVSYLELIKPYQSVDLSNHRHFFIDNERVGSIQHKFAKHLQQFSDVFDIHDDRITLSSNLTNFDKRSAVIKAALTTLADQGVIKSNPYGPHNTSPAFQKVDVFPIGSKPFTAPLAGIERFHFPHFGGLRHNVSAIAYNSKGVWLARRSSQVETYANMLDHTISGSCTIEHDVTGTLIDEARDEAGLTNKIIKLAVSLGAFQIAYTQKSKNIFHEIFHIFKINLPEDFTPKTKFKDEISEFILVSFDELNNEVLHKNNIAPLSKIILIYFLIKQNYISKNHQEYHELIKAFDYDPATKFNAY